MISRYINLLELINKRASVFLLGPRGTGKTALLQEVIEGYRPNVVVDLLKGSLYQRYLASPGLFGEEVEAQIRSSPRTLLVAVDEIQRVPALLDEVHRLIESYKGRVVFLLTGSSARKLRRSGANLLAGRAVSHALFPLVCAELGIELKTALQFGTLPGIYLGDPSLRIDTLDSYVATYLREEVQQESLVRGLDRFVRFLDLAGQLNGEPMNFSKIGQQTGIAGKTAADYYQILSDTLLVHSLPGWSTSVKKQLLQAPKFFFFDCGVLNSINGNLRTEIKESSFLYGKLFETFIIGQIRAMSEYRRAGLRFFYWRDKQGSEIDLILAKNISDPQMAIEIKSGTAPSVKDCPGFRSFSEDYPQVPRVCICRTPYRYEREGITFLPWVEAVTTLIP